MGRLVSRELSHSNVSNYHLYNYEAVKSKPLNLQQKRGRDSSWTNRWWGRLGSGSHGRRQRSCTSSYTAAEAWQTPCIQWLTTQTQWTLRYFAGFLMYTDVGRNRHLSSLHPLDFRHLAQSPLGLPTVSKLSQTSLLLPMPAQIVWDSEWKLHQSRKALLETERLDWISRTIQLKAWSTTLLLSPLFLVFRPLKRSARTDIIRGVPRTFLREKTNCSPAAVPTIRCL